MNAITDAMLHWSLENFPRQVAVISTDIGYIDDLLTVGRKPVGVKMSRTMRFMRSMLILGVILYGVQLLFTHWIFNYMMHRVIDPSLPKGSDITFSSYFVVLPHPQIRVKNLHFHNQQQHRLDLTSVDASIDTGVLWRKRKLAFDTVAGQAWQVQMPQVAFQTAFKQLMFYWIRSKLGVQQMLDPQKQSPGLTKLAISQLTLSIIDGDQRQAYHISDLSYHRDADGEPEATLCFADPHNAKAFYQRYIEIYRIAGEKQDHCIHFHRQSAPSMGQTRV